MTKASLALAVILIAVVVLTGCGPTPTPPPLTPAPQPVLTSPPKQAPATPKLAVTPAPTVERPVSSYYQGKTIEMQVSDSAGGGTDTMARISAPLLTKYIPGNPGIILRNVPGASGVVGNNSFYAKAKPDGLNILVYGSSAISMQLRGRDVVKYDVTKYRHVGHIQRSANVMMVRKGMKARLTDAAAQPLATGTKEGEEAWNAILMWGKEFLGWNVRWIPGYGGTSEMEMALRRGELDVFITSNAYVVSRLMQEGVVDPVLTMGTRKGDKFQRRPDFPDIPTFEEILGDKKPTGIPWQSYMAWIGSLLVDKGITAPPGTSPEVMRILTDAFARTAKDPVFDEKVKRMVSEVYDVGIGDETDSLVRELINTPPAAMEYAVQLQKKFGIVK
ncbi:MAG: hypothetical protein HY673_00030 [Chloroflexi bacterium]|nr:hypothetical protein [Chloroflexota bacterium]